MAKGDTLSQIHELLPKVMAEVGHIAKAGYNDAQGYAFMSYGDVASACQKAFAEHGISVSSRVLDLRREERATRSGGAMSVTLLSVQYGFHAADGSCISVAAVGEGADSGDKATNKAMTAALKYALRTLLVIPDNEDGDADSPQLAPKKVATGRADGGAPQGSGSSRGQASSSPAPAGHANDPWLDVLHNPDGWFDNRADKKNPKAPDFKAKKGNPHWGTAGEFRGEPAPLALWLRDAPPHWEEAFNAGDPSLMTDDGPTGRGKTVAEATAALAGKVVDDPEEAPFF